MDIEKLLGDIVSLSESVRFVFVMDERGKVAGSRVSTRSFLLSQGQASVLAADMHILRQLLRLYDEMLGKNSSVHLVREKVHVLIYYVDKWTVLVSCDREVDRHSLADLSSGIESILQDV